MQQYPFPELNPTQNIPPPAEAAPPPAPNIPFPPPRSSRPLSNPMDKRMEALTQRLVSQAKAVQDRFVGDIPFGHKRLSEQEQLAIYMSPQLRSQVVAGRPPAEILQYDMAMHRLARKYGAT